MEEAAEKNRIFFSPRFFKPSSLSAAVFVAFLFSISFLAFGCSSYLVTISILFLSTIFIISLSKKKVVAVGNPGQDGTATCRAASVLEEVGEKIEPEVQNAAHCEAATEGCLMHEYQVESTDLLYDSESSNDFLASESFELTWKCSDNVGHDITISDSSVSDDEDDDGDDLIEISLPMNNSGHVNEEQKQKLPDYLPESIYGQEGLMELFAEINESNDEENLIEIDLSMDSIKFSRFDIEE